MGHSSRPLRGNFCSASKLSAALWSKTAARCFAFSSGHTSTVVSVPFGSIRTTCHPKALVGLVGQRSQLGTIDLSEQFGAAGTETAHLAGVEFDDKAADSGI